MYLRFFIPIVILLFFSSCKKTADPVPLSTQEAPQISITSPGNNSNYSQGESIPITADIFDNREIYTLSVEIKDLSDNSLVYRSPEQHIHQSVYSLSTSYSVSVATATHYQITIIATDLDGNISTKSTDVSIN